jgi:HAD superfamily hydrolase (TIGR01509 family)
MGISTEAAADYVMRRLELSMTREQVVERIIGRMLDMYRAGVPYMPGAVAAVDLASRHYPVAIASGSHRSLLDVVTADPPMAGKFQAVICSDELGAGKPAPDVYLAAAARLNVAPERCLCLEDSSSGIRSGRAANMKVVAVPDPRFPPPADILPSLQEFDLPLIQSL